MGAAEARRNGSASDCVEAQAPSSTAAVAGVAHVLNNHAKEIIALDFFTVPTATFRVLFVLVVLGHARRRLMHFNVTEHPTADWTARQLLEACAPEASPRYLSGTATQSMANEFRIRLGCSISERWL